jgi:TPR repeat protein
MGGTAWFLALCIPCLTAPGFGQDPDAAWVAALRQRAGQGDAQAQMDLGSAYEYGSRGVVKDYAEALRWYRTAADQGNSEARFAIGQMYLEGKGVARDYTEAARWYGCPRMSEEILASCKEASYKDLPQGALDVLAKLKCEVGSNYDYGSAVDLAGTGTPAYQICCHDSPHGPCGAVVIGKVGSAWKDLTAKEGLLGFESACGLFFVLQSKHEGFHDVCLPNQCSSAAPANGKACAPTIWQFSGGRYRSVASTPPIKPEYE